MHSTTSPEPSADDLLHPTIREWIRSKGWDGLRPVQEEAVAAILRGRGDVIVSAGTASGKTEAAFLPCVSSLLGSPAPSVGILAVSPLKSLINDQHTRLSELGKFTGVSVTRWHGETPRDEKRAVRREPEGIVLITPESLEALLLRRRGEIPKLFGGLRYVIVDELHAFLAGDRGAQLASLLARLDRILGRRPRRIGLSATLGDPKMAAAWLNPRHPENVSIVEEEGARRRIVARVGCVVEAPLPMGYDDLQAEEMGHQTGLSQIAARLFPRLAKGKHLVFAASRRTVEVLADGLRRKAEARGLESPFMPHHGSLAKAYREKVEKALREPGRPATAVATTTLELGIDIGEVERVVNVGPPRSLAGLRQRVGRSGRRDNTVPTLDIEIIARPPPPGGHPVDGLHTDLVCALAAVSLLHKGFVEPPSETPASLSVLVHQVMCICATEAPINVERLVEILREVAPFQAFNATRVRDLLVRLSAPSCGILERLGEGFVRLGPAGHAIVMTPDVFSVFMTPTEFTLCYMGSKLGQVPVAAGSPVGPGDYVLFQGQRWCVEEVDLPAKTAHVTPAPRAGSLKFEGGEPAPMHDRLIQTMRAVYESDVVPPILDATGRNVLFRARAAYQRLELARNPVHRAGNDVVLIPFVGTMRLKALAFALQSEGLKASLTPISIIAEGIDTDTMWQALANIGSGRMHRLFELFGTKGGIPEDKFDGVLEPGFRAQWWIEVNGIPGLALTTARQLLAMRQARRPQR